MTAADARRELADNIGTVLAKGGDHYDVADYLLSAFPQIAPPSGNEAVEAARFIRELKKKAVLEEHDFPGDSPVVCGYTCFLCQRHAGDADDIPHAPDCPITMARYILSIAPGKDVVVGARALVINAMKEGELGKALPARLEPLTQRVAAFATACVAQEREACAKIAEASTLHPPYTAMGAQASIADAIRRRTP